MRAEELVLQLLLTKTLIFVHLGSHLTFEDRFDNEHVAHVLDAYLLELVVVESFESELNVLVAYVGKHSGVGAEHLLEVVLMDFVLRQLRLTGLGHDASFYVLKDQNVLDGLCSQEVFQHLLKHIRVNQLEAVLVVGVQVFAMTVDLRVLVFVALVILVRVSSFHF